ncbi:winged helix-turn-helix transcriptional regulator [Roseibium sp. M-1]
MIGDRWAHEGVCESMFAPRRFQMIRAGLPGITASVLTSRLTLLSRAGVVNYDRRMGCSMSSSVAVSAFRSKTNDWT